MIRIAIVEDEDQYIHQFTEYLHNYQDIIKEEIAIDIYHDGDEITSKYKSQYDIILMDIQMKFVNGMTAAQEIRTMDSEVIIIFITNMSQYAIHGYKVGALDYILKPVSYFSFCFHILVLGFFQPYYHHPVMIVYQNFLAFSIQLYCTFSCSCDILIRKGAGGL